MQEDLKILPCVDCLVLGICRLKYLSEGYNRYSHLIYLDDLESFCELLRIYRTCKTFELYMHHSRLAFFYLVGNNVKEPAKLPIEDY
jgi:hypothetical protein